MVIRSLIVPLAAAVLAVSGNYAVAQGAFPAPLPNQSAPSGPSPFPPVNGAPTASVGAPSAFTNGAAPVAGSGAGFAPPQAAQQGGPPGSEACASEFQPLRQEAEKRGGLIKAAGDRRAPPDEACKLIGNFAQSEIKMINYVQLNQQKCGIPPQVADQLKAGHKNTEVMLKKVCAVAQQQQQQPTRGPAAPSLSDVLGSSASLPEATPGKKSGGTTFDTLSGNVLTR